MSFGASAGLRASLSASGGAAASLSAGAELSLGGLNRASLLCKETGQSLEVQYNPTEITLDKAVMAQVPAAKAASKGANPESITTHTRTLGFTLTLDKWSTGNDVVDAANLIQSWMNPTDQSISAGKPAPATIEFLWWNDSDPFVGLLTQAKVTYAVFDSSGRPVRATVAVAMHELAQPPSGQNPTSGTPRPGRTILVREGDTLAAIAYREYGDPTLWRGVAHANRVCDPLALQPGLRLQLPALTAARELAR